MSEEQQPPGRAVYMIMQIDPSGDIDKLPRDEFGDAIFLSRDIDRATFGPHSEAWWTRSKLEAELMAVKIKGRVDCPSHYKVTGLVTEEEYLRTHPTIN